MIWTWFDNITVTEIVLLSVLLAGWIYQMYFFLRFMRPFRANKEISEQCNLPGVSVIICAHNEADNLSNYLRAILLQDYPLYEVIVVDDGSMDMTRLVVERYHQTDDRVHCTFVPTDARVMSTKKLGITLAAKAAKYDYLLLTDADCVPASNQWIKKMVAPFIANPKTEIVLGYGAYFENKTILNRIIEYDTIFNAMHFLGCARSHRPYMGVGRNLAYKKEMFFRTGGFSDQMTTRSGDDDLLVNKVANRENTAVVTDAEAATWSVPKKTFVEWWMQKKRHLSVSNHYTLRSRLHLGWEPLTRGVFYVALVITLIVGGWLARAIAFVLWLLRLLIQAVCVNVQAHTWKHKGFSIGLILWDIVLPICNFAILSRRKNYTIQHW